MAATDGRLAAVARLAAVLAAAAALASGASAGVLPEDRADVLYHSYDGGGVTIEGPSLLVRKQFADKFSASANYYVDRVTSASIDVVSTASPYTEERTQYSLGLDYLHDSWMLSLGFTSSEENDYTANTFSIGVSQDFFGDLTTLSLGYSVGSDEVRRRGDSAFSADVDRRQYRLGLSQILTRSLMLGLSFETITDEGFLNNPYRSVRFLDDTNPRGYSWEAEVYPRTRTSDAAAIRLRYYLPYRAALHAEYRTYTDTWDIRADTFELGYTHPIEGGWIVEAKVRRYSQTAASFYRDLFPRSRFQNFMARDKELSTFDSTTFRLGASYDVLRGGWRFVERGTVNIAYDRILFDYADFRDVTRGGAPGEEPFYSFDADVVQLYLSFWF